MEQESKIDISKIDISKIADELCQSCTSEIPGAYRLCLWSLSLRGILPWEEVSNLLRRPKEKNPVLPETLRGAYSRSGLP